ncbi:methylenetetrahydrofolate reductase [Pseudonocardia xinjiangensis]|uniref:methylenetetrahydrofolate reductase n=1 Tax=Pseudonocardia xinjiangensis TaxID=75289 RepID=UPI001FE2934F|nr:methylenetetrahydrofolate reductase [Pseudonocardia xinjiangensis]
MDAPGELCSRLLDEGVPGLHFYSLTRSTATVDLVTSLRLAAESPAARGFDELGGEVWLPRADAEPAMRLPSVAGDPSCCRCPRSPRAGGCHPLDCEGPRAERGVGVARGVRWVLGRHRCQQPGRVRPDRHGVVARRSAGRRAARRAVLRYIQSDPAPPYA